MPPALTEYMIISDGRNGFGVEVSAPNRFQFVRGFATELDVVAWIVEQQDSEAALAATTAAADHPLAVGSDRGLL